LRKYKDHEGDLGGGEAGLPWAVTNAPSAFMREVARIAIARGDSLGRIGRAKGNATHVISGHFERDPRDATRAWYSTHYGIGEEYAALVEGRPLSDERLQYWTAIVERDYGIARVETGTIERLRAAQAKSPATHRKAVEAFALERYRGDAGIYKGAGKHGTSLVNVAPGWIGKAEDVAFVREMRSALDLIACRRKALPVDGVLSAVALRLRECAFTPAQVDAVLEVVRAMLRANGHDIAMPSTPWKPTCTPHEEKDNDEARLDEEAQARPPAR
jgi:hypothetical protein